MAGQGAKVPPPGKARGPEAVKQHQGKAPAGLSTKPGPGPGLSIGAHQAGPWGAECRCRRREGRLLDAGPPAEDEGNNPDHQEDDKKDLGELRGRAGNAAETEEGRDDGNDEEGQGPMEHIYLLSGWGAGSLKYGDFSPAALSIS